MKILFVGDYQISEILPAPTKVGKELFTHFRKINSEASFYTYFQEGEKYNRSQKLFGFQEIEKGVFRLGLIPFVRNVFQLKPDIIFAVTPAAYYLVILFLKKILKFKYVYYFHSINKHVLNNYLKFPFLLKQRFLFIEKLSVLFGVKLFVLSQNESNLLHKYYKIDSNKIEIVNNGIKNLGIEKSSYTVGPKLNIICVGSMNRKEKSYNILFSALELMKIKFNVTICSQDRYVSSELEIPPNVYLKIKTFDQTALRMEISKNDLFIISSVYESFSISLLEAMSTGIPFIATDKVGLTERFNDQLLISQIISSNNIEALKNKIIDFQFMKEKEREILGKKAIAFSKSYSLDRITNNIWEKLQELVVEK